MNIVVATGLYTSSTAAVLPTNSGPAPHGADPRDRTDLFVRESRRESPTTGSKARDPEVCEGRPGCDQPEV